MHRDDRAQLQLLESVMVALFIFIAIAIVAVYRLPSSPDTFARAELEKVSGDALKVRQAKTPLPSDDCNETSGACPYTNDLERLISLALGARGYTKDVPATETADATELKNFLDQALPAGARYRIAYGNGVSTSIITPLGVQPPAASVVVARNLLLPNWTKFARGVTNTTILRIGEATNISTFGAPTNITDPLNRDSNETGTTWLSALAAATTTTVSTKAVFGTYQVCFTVGASACTKPWYNVTIVPPGGNGTVMGAGSQLLPGDFNRTYAWRNITVGKHLEDLLYLYDDPALTTVRNDALYIHLNNTGSAVVQVGDLRLTRVPICRVLAPCHAGSYVRTGDLDVGRAVLKLTTAVAPGFQSLLYSNDKAYPHIPGASLYAIKSGAQVAAGDVRLSRVGVFQAGSRVVTGQQDRLSSPGYSYTMSRFYVEFSDTDGDAKWDEGEPVVLDYNHGSTDAGVEVYSHLLSQVGEPSQRNAYDIKLEVWYGV